MPLRIGLRESLPRAPRTEKIHARLIARTETSRVNPSPVRINPSHLPMNLKSSPSTTSPPISNPTIIAREIFRFKLKRLLLASIRSITSSASGGIPLLTRLPGSFILSPNMFAVHRIAIQILPCPPKVIRGLKAVFRRKNDEETTRKIRFPAPLRKRRQRETGDTTNATICYSFGMRSWP